MTQVLLLLVLLSQDALSPTPSSDRPRQQVRADDRFAQTIIWDGRETSPTVERLIYQLEHSHVIVYVRTATGLRATGLMTFIARGGDFTYLLIRLDLEHSGPDRIAALAHELTHAMEVAAANPPIGSETELARLYRQIGQQMETGAFESLVAVVNERAARREAFAASTTHRPIRDR